MKEKYILIIMLFIDLPANGESFDIEQFQDQFCNFYALGMLLISLFLRTMFSARVNTH